MPELRRRGKSKLAGQDHSKLRYQAAAGCAAMGFFLMFMALRFHTKDYLMSTPLDHRGGPAYTRLWFDNRDVLAGAIEEGAKLKVDRWSGGVSGVETWNAEFAAPDTKWAIAPDFSRIAWVSGSTVYWQTLTRGAPISPTISPKNASRWFDLPSRPAVLALSALADGSVAVVLADASVHQWESDGKPLPVWRAGPAEADQAAADENYLAIASTRERRLLLYRFREGEGWKAQEEASPPDPPFRILLPARGAMATISAEGLRMGGRTWNTAGAVHATVKRLEDVIAAGEFDQVVVLPDQKEDERYTLAQAPPGSVLAATSKQLAVSGPNGTNTFNLLTEKRLTASGRQMSQWCVVLFLATIVLACWVLLCDGVGFCIGLLFNPRVKQGLNPRQFPDPPPGLVLACAMGKSALWAGAGLSAQCGLPLRANFIASILQSAALEGLIAPAMHLKLKSLYSKGDLEGVLNGLIEAAPWDAMVGHYRSMLNRIVVPSRAHKLLAGISFAAAVTTNYDFLLQQAGGLWAAAATTLKSARSGSFGDRTTLLKLYGDLDQPETLLLSRIQFMAAVKTSAEADRIRRMLGTHPVLFVGSSLEGLLADLRVLGAPERDLPRHFALVGVAGGSWQGRAAELKRRYGVEVLACDVETVQKALVEFLVKLVNAVDQRPGEAGTATGGQVRSASA